MIRSDFWFKYRIFFDEIPFGNDLNFSMKISFLAKRYEIITNRLYCLTYSSNSVTYKARSYELESLSLILRAQLNIYFKDLIDLYGINMHLFIFCKYFKGKEESMVGGI